MNALSPSLRAKQWRAPPPIVVWLVVASWVGLAVWVLAGHSVGEHERVHDALETSEGIAGSVLAFGVAWQLMATAMMLPPAARVIRRVESRLRGASQARVKVLGFVAGYLTLWAAAGVAFLFLDVSLHNAVDGWPWLSSREWLVECAVLTGAGIWQLSERRRVFTRRCRNAQSEGGEESASPDQMAVAGFRYGLLSAASCVAVMLAAMAVVIGSGFALALVAVATIVLVEEHGGPDGERVGLMIGGLLLAGAAALAAVNVL